ncbi:MAG: hypothetical protein LBD86_00640, partial [Spirochaetaceae bacterium]|nr:hypothetical protein [Spirochaetaceae bacterium]
QSAASRAACLTELALVNDATLTRYPAANLFATSGRGGSLTPYTTRNYNCSHNISGILAYFGLPTFSSQIFLPFCMVKPRSFCSVR